MKVDTTANRLELKGEERENAAVRTRIVDYLARTGLTQPDFARRVGYSVVTLRFFLSGQYHNVGRSSRHFVAAAEDFMRAHPIGHANRVQGELYDTANVRKIRQTFEQLLPRPVAQLIYAPPGSQKTFALEHEVARLNRVELSKDDGRRAYYVYARQGIRPRDLVRRVAVALGCRSTLDVDSMLNGIRFDYRDRRVLLVVDEAQHLSLDCFETLRELLDQPPCFSLLFAGSHDLKRMFDEFSATLEQWNSRIVAKVRLPGLERGEAVGIIEREIGALVAVKSERERTRLYDQLIEAATVSDHFEKGRQYINVRTLSNALDQIKAASAESARTAQPIEEVA